MISNIEINNNVGNARNRLNRLNRTTIMKSKIKTLLNANWSYNDIAFYLKISTDLIISMYGYRQIAITLGSKTEPYFKSEDEILKSLTELNYNYNDLSYSEKKIYDKL